MKKKGCILPLSLIFLLPLINSIYIYLNNSTRGIHSLVTDMDKAVPFIKYFSVPYLMWYPFLFSTLIYLCFRNRTVYYQVIMSLIIGLIVCYITYYLFQTKVPRPQLQGNDFFTSLVRFIYSTDSPFNCFPSIHVLSSFLIIKGVMSCNKKVSIESVIIPAIAVLIILSTQFIKQHVIMDLVFAILLGNSIYKLVQHFSMGKTSVQEVKVYKLVPATKKVGINTNIL